MAELGRTGTDAKELEGRPGEDENKSRPREFFWDSVVLFVLSSVVGLAAIDAITEFIRGSDVRCYIPNGLNGTDVSMEYINTFCSGSLPPTQFFPAFILVSGVVIAIPHYLWLNHYGGNFEFFFTLAARLDRLREESGEYSMANHLIVQQADAAFATYNQNTIFYVYTAKLFLQWVFSLASFFTAAAYFTNFEENFICPQRAQDISNPYWPFNEQAMCVFTSLRLIWLIRFAYLVLLALVILGLLWALLWCFSTHTSELGSKDVAKFAFESGLAPQYFVPKLPVPRHFRGLIKFLHRYVTSIPWFSKNGPCIKTDLDFMVMKLYRTDSGLGYVFRDVQISREMKNLINEDQRRLNLHYWKHTNIDAENTPLDKDSRAQDLGWKFRKEKDQLGVYFEFKPIVDTDPLPLPKLIHGAVLGFGSRVPDNASAISISFGSTGYATALARVFQWVGSINFSPYYNHLEKPVSIHHFHTNVVSVKCKENILAAETDARNQFVMKLKALWIPPNQELFLDTSFVVIGPIDKELHLTTVDLLLGQIAGCLLENSVLLTVRPIMIEGKDTSGQFFPYYPSERSFSPLKQEVKMFTDVKEWAARVQDEVPISTVVQQTSLPASPKLSKFALSGIQCGSTKCVIEFATYMYTNDPPAERPNFYSEVSQELPNFQEELPVKPKMSNVEQEKMNASQ